MKIKNILVTGASGRIGRNLVPELIKAGYRVRAVQFETPVTFFEIKTRVVNMFYVLARKDEIEIIAFEIPFLIQVQFPA